MSISKVIVIIMAKNKTWKSIFGVFSSPNQVPNNVGKVKLFMTRNWKGKMKNKDFMTGKIKFGQTKRNNCSLSDSQKSVKFSGGERGLNVF